MRIGWLVLIALSGLILVGCGNQPTVIIVSGITFDNEEIAQGQQLYAQNCASCHGANGEGQFPNAPNQPDATGRVGAPPHNETGHTWHHTDDFLIRYTREGGVSLTDPANFYPMPAFGDQLSDAQIALVTAYIKTMWNDEQRTSQQRAVAATRQNPLMIQPPGN
ncbi:MAG: cytochrome c [Chloroflexota bacterium]|nr:cytochrome c [Chloroflexota bacterium]